MKIFTEKGILNKLLLILIAIIVFNAVIPTNVSYAADAGGVLLKPIADFMIAIGDFVMDLANKVIYGVETSLIKVDLDNGIWEAILIILAVVLVALAVVGAGAALVTYGPAIISAFSKAVGWGAVTVSAGAKVAAIGVIAIAGVKGATAAGLFVRSQFFSEEVVFPLYRVTPEEIFSGEVALLNVNFFADDEINDDEVDTSGGIINQEVISGFPKNYTFDSSNTSATDENTAIGNLLANYEYSGTKFDNAITVIVEENTTRSVVDSWSYNGEAYQATLEGLGNYTYVYDGLTAELAPVWESTDYTFTIAKGEWQGYQSIGQQLKSTVAKWYYAIRNFALIAMMIILLYIGIRIMLCGVSSEKAKYKNMLMDWVISICLIFIMHYIMAFSMNIVDGLIKVFGSINNENSYLVSYEYDEKVVNALKESGEDIDSMVYEENGNKYLLWDAKNLVGLVRVQAAKDNVENTGSYTYIGYVICYLVLVCYTLFFLYTYLRRALYLTFFTIIAPLVAMTYPIDKLHDGKAQAFDMWFKEYIFNLMIQPVHLLLYTVLISSAFELASTNIIYAIVAIGFMMPAEKFLRKMFGFDKAQTPGFLDGAAGTALLVSGFNKIFRPRHQNGGKRLANATKGGKLGAENKEVQYQNTEDYFGDDEGVNEDENANGSPQWKAPVNPLFNNHSEQQLPVGQQNATEQQPPFRQQDTTEQQLPFRQQNATEQQPPSRQQNSAGQQNPTRSNQPSISTSQDKKNKKRWKRLQRIDKLRADSTLIGDIYRRKTAGKSSLDILREKEEKEANSKTRKLIKGVKGAANEYGKQQAQKLANYIGSGQIIEDVSNVAEGAVGASAGFMAGTIATTASGQGLSKLTTYGGGLAAAGYAFGSKSSKQDYDEQAVYDEFIRSQYDSEEKYQEAMLQERINEIIEDEKNLRKVREYLGQKYDLRTLGDAKTFMQKHSDIIGKGYEDMKYFCAIADKREGGMNKDLSTTLAKYYKKAGGKPKNMAPDSDARKNIEHLCKKAIVKAKPEIKGDSNQIKIHLDNLLKQLDDFGDTMDGFTSLPKS